MKKKAAQSLLLLLLGTPFLVQAQDKIQDVLINENVSTHFTSEQQLDYTDISAEKKVVGDHPLPNVLRIKPIKSLETDMGYVTIVGEGFFVQYRLRYTPDADRAHKHVDIDGAPEDIGFVNPNFGLTTPEIEEYASSVYGARSSINNVVAKANRLRLKLRNIWVKGDYIFFDYSARNRTDLKYDIDQTRFKIVDEKVSKAENSQDQEIEPVFLLNRTNEFNKEYHNVAVFKKFTFPDDKNFTIELSEKQISGRTLTLHIAYSDLLQAKSL